MYVRTYVSKLQNDRICNGYYNFKGNAYVHMSQCTAMYLISSVILIVLCASK